MKGHGKCDGDGAAEAHLPVPADVRNSKASMVVYTLELPSKSFFLFSSYFSDLTDYMGF